MHLHAVNMTLAHDNTDLRNLLERLPVYVFEYQEQKIKFGSLHTLLNLLQICQ